jgi:hypothetical protein
LIPNPIHKVLSTLSTHEVRYLLMGGQACVFYGAAEFSRDCDVAILCDSQNLTRLQAALNELAARPIAVPPFTADYLERGHAVHFRCQIGEAVGMRLDVMAKMRGVAPFEELWSRRTTVEDEYGGRYELMDLADVVTAKKTQRDKDWPMIRRLVESHYSQHHATPTHEQTLFWLREARTPEILVELAASAPQVVEMLLDVRPLLEHARSGDRVELENGLAAEERRERDADRKYWQPLKEELEKLRHAKN